jgi:hypothetical protein
MKPFLAAGFLLVVNDGLAHPGHGKPGLLHFHEFPDGLMILIGLVAVALLCWAWKK